MFTVCIWNLLLRPYEYPGTAVGSYCVHMLLAGSVVAAWLAVLPLHLQRAQVCAAGAACGNETVAARCPHTIRFWGCSSCVQNALALLCVASHSLVARVAARRTHGRGRARPLSSHSSHTRSTPLQSSTGRLHTAQVIHSARGAPCTCTARMGNSRQCGWGVALTTLRRPGSRAPPHSSPAKVGAPPLRAPTPPDCR